MNVEDFNPALTQLADWNLHIRYLQQISQLSHLIGLMEKSNGTTKEQLASLVEKKNEYIRADDILIRSSIVNKSNTARHILRCELIADIATQFADEFADCLAITSRGEYKDNSFSLEMKRQAKEWEKFMRTIDDADNPRIENAYAEVADEVIDAVTKAIDDVLARKAKDPQWSRIFYDPNYIGR